MTWHGIPFKVIENEIFYQASLEINKIPEVVFNASFGWGAFWTSIIGAMIAGAIPGIIAVIAMRSNSNMLKTERDAQNKIATDQLNAKLISSNRHVWINDLRNTSAEYISAVAFMVNQMNMIAHEYMKGERKNIDAYNDAIKFCMESKERMSFLNAKIKLLLNPDEEESKEIYTSLDEIAQLANKHDYNVRVEYDNVNPIVKKLIKDIQKILKNEWVRVKTNQ